jgi:hypothetical protein
MHDGRSITGLSGSVILVAGFCGEILIKECRNEPGIKDAIQRLSVPLSKFNQTVFGRTLIDTDPRQYGAEDAIPVLGQKRGQCRNDLHYPA